MKMDPKSLNMAQIVAVIYLITAMVFAADMMTALDLVFWVLYPAVLALTVGQSSPGVPFGVAVVQVALIAVSFAFKVDDTFELLPVLNRIGGAVSLLAVAYVARRVILQRGVTTRLLWRQAGQTAVTDSLIGEQTLQETANAVLGTLAPYVGAQVGLLYHYDRKTLLPVGTYGCALPGPVAVAGLAQEAVRRNEIITIDDVPAGYLQVASLLGETVPRLILILPLISHRRVTGVVELGFVALPQDLQALRELLRQCADTMGVALQQAAYREHLKALLSQTQRQGEEMQMQQEELRVSNEELAEQGRALRESQKRLENQHAELEQTNIQLEEHAQRLARQREDLLLAQRAMQTNAQELNRVNQYKSQFLANMSHELRTPLNSSLILSQILSGSQGENLSIEQRRKYARTIYDSNNDLLLLINDILDLSKIEAGHVDLLIELTALAAVVEPLRQMFEPLAAQRGLGFVIDVAASAPATLETDRGRLAQILKNLLSNAFKFTTQGQVRLRIETPVVDRVAFHVCDSGIGITLEQQAIIFEAFRQADGTTSRKYGGTGLGLSISRELARLLDGSITLHSEPGKGSTFTVEISTQLQPAASLVEQSSDLTTAVSTPVCLPAPAIATSADALSQPCLADGEARYRHILVIEDDERFVTILAELARELNFDCTIAGNGTEALEMARMLRPSAILLDVDLPDQSGLGVLEQLKRDPATRHIPIHMMSVEDHRQTALELGAVGYVLKPAARDELVAAFAKVEHKLAGGTRRVLVIEDDHALRTSIACLLGADDVEVTLASSAAEALDAVRHTSFDCVVMDLMLPDASGYELLERMAGGARFDFPPVIVYTGRVLTRAEEQRLQRYSRSIIIKGARSPERLLDEITLFLHRVESQLPPDQQRLLVQARQRDAVLEQRKILLVEDDVRNIFALSSVFEPLGVQLAIARNGCEALDYLEHHTDVDLVLMDLMMPKMDGLTAMRQIRGQSRWAKLSIIALTAKAMADDRRACLDAGANDYVAKPIDIDKLVSLCRVWMPK
jgi:CheY-like chemotaxis protein